MSPSTTLTESSAQPRRRARSSPTLEALEPRTLLSSAIPGFHRPAPLRMLAAAAHPWFAAAPPRIHAAVSPLVAPPNSAGGLLPTVGVGVVPGPQFVGEPLTFVVYVSPGTLGPEASEPLPPGMPPITYTIQMNVGTPASPNWVNVGSSRSIAVTVVPVQSGPVQIRAAADAVVDADILYDTLFPKNEPPPGYSDVSDLRGAGPGPDVFLKFWRFATTDFLLRFYSAPITISPQPETTPNNPTDIVTQTVVGDPRESYGTAKTAQVAAAADAPPAEGRGNMTIGGAKMTQTEKNYQDFIKHLVVPPEKQNDPIFKNGTLAQIQKAGLEDPLRRLIFDRMNNNTTNTFNFANLAAAQRNFAMRIAMIDFMNMICTGKVDFNYYDNTKKPTDATADPKTWEPYPGGPVFAFRSKSGVDAHDAIAGLVANKFLGECVGAVQAALYYGANVALKDPKAADPYATFDALHPNGLIIGKASGEMGKHIGVNVTTNPALKNAKGNLVVNSIPETDIVPGDWLYIKNKDDYNANLKAGVPRGYYSGENAIYMGDFATAADKNVAPRYSGMGLCDMTLAQMQKKISDAYNTNNTADRTKDGVARTANPADVRITSVKRPVTGG